jgi:hypothetical protein
MMLLALLLLQQPAAVAIITTTNTAAATRAALEQPGDVDVVVPTSARLSNPLRCLLDRKPCVGWPGYTRPNGTKKTSDGVGMPATLLPPDGPDWRAVRCHLSRAEWPLLTGGNASLTVDSINGSGSRGGVPGGRAVELFAIFEPQWGRRPYLREKKGSLVLEVDRSLAVPGLALQVSASLPGDVTIKGAVPAGRRVRIPFSLAEVPSKVDEVITIQLQLPDGTNITKTRRFIRHPPPSSNASLVTWQVDHERGGGLLADGIPFLAQGWFNGGWNHELDSSLGARYFAQHYGVSEPSFFERMILNLGSLAQEWGKRGINFVRFQSQVFPNTAFGFPVELTTLYLDLAAAAGVFVIFDCSIDTIAKAGFNGTADPVWQELLANLTLVRDHPALAGYYACDDCCHVRANANEHEYRGIEQIHQALREFDPYHLFIGSSACPDVWMWQEGLEFNAGAPAGVPSVSDVGLDVVMRESYSGGGPGDSSLSPTSRGVRTERAARYYPMTFAASWDMPAPANYVTPGAFRAALYGNAIHQNKFSFNAFAFDDTTAADRPIDEAFFGFAMEAAELRNSWLSMPLDAASTLLWQDEHHAEAIEQIWLVAVESNPPCVSHPHGKMRPTTLETQDCGAYGRLWIEGGKVGAGDSSGVGLCAHLVLINPQARSLDVTVTLATSTSLHQRSILPTAQRLFDQTYTVNLSTAAAATLTMSDGLSGRSAAIYRLGCKVTPLTPNIVHNGDFEDVDLSNPGRFCQRGSCSTTRVGRPLFDGVGANAGWRLLYGTPYLPAIFDAHQDDFRAQIRPDTSAPFHGRHCLKLKLPSRAPSILPIPLQQSMYGTEPQEDVEATTTILWTLNLQMRSSPPGAKVVLFSGGCYSAPWAIAGDQLPDAKCGPNSAQPRRVSSNLAAVGVEWTTLRFQFENATLYSQNLWLNVSAPCANGAHVWLDAITLVGSNTTRNSSLSRGDVWYGAP